MYLYEECKGCTQYGSQETPLRGWRGAGSVMELTFSPPTLQPFVQSFAQSFAHSRSPEC